MKNWKAALILVLALTLALPGAAFAAERGEGAPDYAEAESWAYFALGEDTGVDVFLICPTVDTRSETNSFDLNEKLKGKFVSALDMEKGIYEEAGRLYSPYYRQMSMNAYKLSEEARAEAREIAYADVSAAFRWYLDNENGGRGLILAGFSQGADMCLELMKEYYGGDSAEAQRLRDGLVTVYAIGWSVTEEMAETYPQIIPARGETDVGTVVCFDCEDGSLTDSLVIPAGTKARSINPLNWKTDATPADKALNSGAVLSTGAEPIPALCGAYIGERGELVVTDVTAAEYPAVIDIFPDGSYHIYDYMFFFEDLRENIALRVNAWRTGLPFKDVPAGKWYEDAVKYVCEAGLMEGMSSGRFSPNGTLTRAQLVTILWRLAGEPVVNYLLPYTDVEQDAWYAEAARWAAAEKVTDRAEGAFGPNDKLCRDEAVALLWNCAKWRGVDVSVGESTNILSYDDAFDIGAGYAAAMQWAVGAGVIEGTGAGKLEPKGMLTRAQTAAMLMRFDAAASAPQRTIPIPAWYEDISGAAACDGCGDHAASPYFGGVDVFELLPTDSLTILPHYRTYQQTTYYSCGAASTVMLMEYYGVYDEAEHDERSIAEAMHVSPDFGIQAGSIAEYLEALGWHVEVSTMGEARFNSGDYDRDVSDFSAWVQENLQSGHPILVEWLDWGGHWQTIIGYDTMGSPALDDDVLIMADSFDTSDHHQDGYYIVNATRFFSMWDNHLLLVEGNPQQYVLAWPD